MTTVEANAQALRLRVRYGLSYEAINAVMAEYHDMPYGASVWRQRVRAMGAPMKLHGRPFKSPVPR